jgi:hypothetical protein
VTVPSRDHIYRGIFLGSPRISPHEKFGTFLVSSSFSSGVRAQYYMYRSVQFKAVAGEIVWGEAYDQSYYFSVKLMSVEQNTKSGHCATPQLLYSSTGDCATPPPMLYHHVVADSEGLCYPPSDALSSRRIANCWKLLGRGLCKLHSGVTVGST